MKLKTLKAAQLHKIISIGHQMSNLCFNLGQESVRDPAAWLRNKEVMKELAKKWDEALRENK